MASHNRTPKSVLSAPTPHPFIIAQPFGLSRAERRAGSRKGLPERLFPFVGIPNTPHVGNVRDAVAAHVSETARKKPLLKRVFRRA